MFHLEDIVEEIATKRQGKLDSSQGTTGQEPDTWRVYFSDGKEPVMKYFKNVDELRLIKCPHESTVPGFVPSRSIME